jgi:hypothetical protein
MKNLFVILLFASLLTQGCSEDDLCLIGSGSLNEYTLDLDEFKNVTLIGPINLRIIQAPDSEVTVDAEPEIFSELTYEVKSGTLRIGFEENITCFETDYGVWVNVTLPDIETISSSGVSEIISDGDLELDYLELDISGTSYVELSGRVTDQIIESSGVLNTKNFELITDNTDINISGTGELEITCNDHLDIEVSGAATVSYKGNPTINQDVSGSLNLINAN